MDKSLRNDLRNIVTKCRKLLEDNISEILEGQFGIHKDGKVEDAARMGHLSSSDHNYREQTIVHIEHIKASGFKASDAISQLVREVAFTHLNRLVAYKMMEQRKLIRESVNRGTKSRNFSFYLADHPEDEKLSSSGKEDIAYRHFLEWLGEEHSQEIGVLFSPNDPANRLFPRQKVLDQVLELINSEELKNVWNEDETIGWVYQYFTPKELRDQARNESSAPRNSYELAFRNQFYTPRYVVEFLTDNTLGRIWYEMRKGVTTLKEKCKYLVRRPNENFLSTNEKPPQVSEEAIELSQEELLKLPVYIPHRPKKDPRDIKILDPACGSGHFLLYCFDLLEAIYEEAYQDSEFSSSLKNDYPSLAELKKAIPGLILRHNLHGIDIDLRATQIAALALWMRAQRAYQEIGLTKNRPKITKSNIVCAEPMPGEKDMLEEFIANLQPRILGQFVRVIFEKMKLAGEAGSLLKIEEEIKDVIAEAKKLWQRDYERATDKYGNELLFTKAEMDKAIGKDDIAQLSLFDVSEITEEEFWNEAETLVIDALHKYAKSFSNGKGLQRQLFANDTERGFAFVDIGRKRFDVIVMNPPFGDSTPGTRTFLGKNYSISTQDLGMCFVSRGHSLISKGGFIGSITSRTFLTNEGLTNWRQQELLGKDFGLTLFADLGYGVLDEAKVEAASYILGYRLLDHKVDFISVLNKMDKKDSLLSFVQSPFQAAAKSFSIKKLDFFKKIPGFVFCYWLSEKFLNTCLSMPNLKKLESEARVGLQTGDNNRFVRAVWEVPNTLIGNKNVWVYFAKGGEYEPFYDDIHLVVLWSNNGETIKNFVDENGNLLSRPQNLQFYLKEGITYPDRTTSDFSPRIMPEGVIFSSTGFGIFPKTKEAILGYLGAAYTRPFKVLIEPFVGSGDSSVAGSMARHYRPGLLNALPNFLSDVKQQIYKVINESIIKRIDSFVHDETSRYYIGFPFINKETSVKCHAITRYMFYAKDVVELIKWNYQIEVAVLEKIDNVEMEDDLNFLHGFHPEKYQNRNLSCIEEETIIRLLDLSELQLIEEVKETLGSSRQIVMKSYFADRQIELISHILKLHPKNIFQCIEKHQFCPTAIYLNTVEHILSYTVGIILGRWDITSVSSKPSSYKQKDPFEPLPICSPGMLQGEEGLPLCKTPSNYSISINWNGILVDDLSNSDDIIKRIQHVLEIFWQENTESIEKEICEALNIENLRDYFRKSTNDGFWMNHVKCYSKSRRKAPIYWLLQSSKKNYAIWIYYHRLDKDIYFKALVNYVQPKIRLEESNLEQLRSKKGMIASSGREAKQLEKQIEKQDLFLSELHDFHDKLQRVATLNLEPDLNDGVVLNIAPLYELVPWSEAKKCWQELLAGKYEWSTIGKQLRQKGLVK